MEVQGARVHPPSHPQGPPPQDSDFHSPPGPGSSPWWAPDMTLRTVVLFLSHVWETTVVCEHLISDEQCLHL